MVRIPLARRLGTSVDATQLIEQFARLWCPDYFAALDSLLGNTSYSDDIPLAGDRQLAVWVARMDNILSDMPPTTRKHMLYRSLVEPFARLKKEGE